MAGPLSVWWNILLPKTKTGHEPDVGLWPACVLVFGILTIGWATAFVSFQGKMRRSHPETEEPINQRLSSAHPAFYDHRGDGQGGGFHPEDAGAEINRAPAGSEGQGHFLVGEPALGADGHDDAVE